MRGGDEKGWYGGEWWGERRNFHSLQIEVQKSNIMLPRCENLISADGWEFLKGEPNLFWLLDDPINTRTNSIDFKTREEGPKKVTLPPNPLQSPSCKVPARESHNARLDDEIHFLQTINPKSLHSNH